MLWVPPWGTPWIYKDFTLQGLPKFTNINPSAGSPLAPGLFPMAEKGKECRGPVRWMVRKAILNEPKPFGHFCAPKVMKRIGIPELLRRFGHFWASKVTKNLKFVLILKLMTLPARGCILECSFDSYRNRRAAQKKGATFSDSSHDLF